MIIIKIGNSRFMGENVIFHVYQKWLKIIPFLHMQKILSEGWKMDNHWIGLSSVMKPVDAASFKRIKYTKEGGDRKNDEFDMDILEKFLYRWKNHGKKYMR